MTETIRMYAEVSAVVFGSLALMFGTAITLVLMALAVEGKI
jgi:hypothetical protein